MGLLVGDRNDKSEVHGEKGEGGREHTLRSRCRVERRWIMLTVSPIAQCPREGCGGGEAFFYQVQIRSADEPMTTFYKVTRGFLVEGYWD